MYLRVREREGREERESLCAFEAVRSQCVYKGVESSNDQRVWDQHIHQGSPQGQKLKRATETGKKKCCGPRRNEIIYSRNGVEGIWRQVCVERVGWRNGLRLRSVSAWDRGQHCGPALFPILHALPLKGNSIATLPHFLPSVRKWQQNGKRYRFSNWMQNKCTDVVQYTGWGVLHEVEKASLLF